MDGSPTRELTRNPTSITLAIRAAAGARSKDGYRYPIATRAKELFDFYLT
jgi:hypothetical protein